MIERRKQPRAKIQCRVFFETCDPKNQEVSQDIGMALDISEKGLLLESKLPIHASTIKVMVPVKDETAVEVVGDVIYSIPMPDERYRTGIVFHELEDDLVKLLCDKLPAD